MECNLSNTNNAGKQILIQRLDNFLPDQLALDMQSALLSDSFPWYFNDAIAYSLNTININSFQFTHSFYKPQINWNSDWFMLGQAMLYITQSKLGIPINNIFRMKANLLTRTNDEETLCEIHKDHDEIGYKSLLYYVDDSDGDTIFFDESKKYIIDKETPKKNSAIFFDSNIYHTGNRPKKNKRRIVINTILKIN